MCAYVFVCLCSCSRVCLCVYVFLFVFGVYMCFWGREEIDSAHIFRSCLSQHLVPSMAFRRLIYSQRRLLPPPWSSGLRSSSHIRADTECDFCGFAFTHSAIGSIFCEFFRLTAALAAQVLDSPERLWTWPPGGGGGGGLMLTNRLRMPAVLNAEPSATTTKEEALLVRLYRLSMKLSDIRPEGQWHELNFNDLMSARSRSRRGTSDSAVTGSDPSSPPKTAGSGGRGGGHVEPYESPVASAKLASARRRRRNSLGLHAHREEEGTGDEATGRKMSYVGGESGRYRGVVAFEGQGGYAGMWLDGMADGIGIEYSGGMLYEGQYKCDVRHGFGAITCDNITWEGSWEGGRRDGDGIESKILPDGGILPIATTRYEKGKRVSIRRFDPEGAEVDFLLRVRGVCERARVSAREAAADGHIIRVQSQVLDLGDDDSVISDSGMADRGDKSPSKGKRRQRGVKEKTAEIMRKEKASLNMIDHKVQP